MHLPVQTTAGPSMAQSKENYFPPSLQVIIIFWIFPLICPPRPWWVLKNRPWWTRSTTTKFLSSLATQSVHLRFQNGKLLPVNARKSIHNWFIIEVDSFCTARFPKMFEYLELVLVYKFMVEWNLSDSLDIRQTFQQISWISFINRVQSKFRLSWFSCKLLIGNTIISSAIRCKY